ncbi:hypothetical protein B2G69_25305 [Methylorubrum zatmanii]|nr:DUF3768 domain-containing protein [Methylorubrum zatmanii]ARO57151.1 hypothetical protein B2G69_25305 [Methylorubrum zatmanii]
MAAASATAHPHQVRDINDAFRRSFTGGQVTLTAGVAALPEATRAVLLAAVRYFDAFHAANDPHSEHDFSGAEGGTCTPSGRSTRMSGCSPFRRLIRLPEHPP